MAFTSVSWESRSAEVLARDLTEGSGPTSIGQTGAAWVRVADELAAIHNDYVATVAKIKSAFVSQGGDAVARKLDDFGQWLAAASLSAAGNGEQAEQSAVAYSVAVLAMPSVSEAVQARTVSDIMGSLAAYNGAVLDGRFAEFDEAATRTQANAAAVMYQYEDANSALAAPWLQPPPPDVCTSRALDAERASDTNAEDAAAGGGAGGTSGMPAPAPIPLAPFRSQAVAGTSTKAVTSSTAASGATSGGAGLGGGYGPMGAMARGSADREHHSSIVGGPADGGAESGSSLSSSDASWIPVTSSHDAPFVNVSWDATGFDDGLAAGGPDVDQFAHQQGSTLEQVSDHWAAPAVIGADRELTL
ncbi:hypothetical protein MARA_01640 (plasmid) [Mycolicibacterium arabiense]|uniref:PPE domain-containing protein n=1 Tax=Mycolicibacterium arabiense TaxID=1286181 RepID=A0A7I7RQ85_9MYCO|nr:PPE domain-containing protein [Mycolicibacterium arabiense]MCV7376923.1 PPE domain-containing protein [Mycolicibacterium arabiense]BBY46734.1 hypothetical protein MARA_01640 [Mycolicibacterium arabiense]